MNRCRVAGPPQPPAGSARGSLLQSGSPRSTRVTTARTDPGFLESRRILNRHTTKLLSSLTILACIGPLQAWAHQGDNDSDHDDGLFLDCDRLPADALSTVPPPVAEYVQVECSAEGQKLVAAKGWRWRYPASWTVRPEAPSWAPDASRQVMGKKYFTQFQVEPLGGEAIAAAHQRLSGLGFSTRCSGRTSALYAPK